jgi:hypothetical protein
LAHQLRQERFHESCVDVFARIAVLDRRTVRRIHGEDALPVVARIFAGRHHVGRNNRLGRRTDCDTRYEGNNIANNFEAQVKQVFSQIDAVLRRAGGGLDNVVIMTVFIKESRYGDRFVEMRKVPSKMETIRAAR